MCDSTGALDECIRSFWGDTHELWQGQGSAQGWCLLPMFPESNSIASRHVANLKPLPQVEASGQENGPFSQAD